MKFVFDPLTKDNYDTWKLHVEALMVKSDNSPRKKYTLMLPSEKNF